MRRSAWWNGRATSIDREATRRQREPGQRKILKVEKQSALRKARSVPLFDGRRNSCRVVVARRRKPCTWAEAKRRRNCCEDGCLILSSSIFTNGQSRNAKPMDFANRRVKLDFALFCKSSRIALARPGQMARENEVENSAASKSNFQGSLFPEPLIVATTCRA